MSGEPEDNGNVSLEEDSNYRDEVQEKKSVDSPRIEEDDSHLSTTDICRICHMGGFPAVNVPSSLWEWSKQSPRRNASQTSTLSSYAYLGPLISACKCRGTVALVHTECLERWLTESRHTRCELCGYKYLTKRVPRHGVCKSIWIWFNTVIATKQMIFDFLYFVITIPLALSFIYICALLIRMILDSGFNEIPWMIVAMLPPCSLTLAAYWSWLITVGRYIRLHGRRWRRFWRNNFVVRLLPDDPTRRNENDENISNTSRATDDFEDVFQMNF